MIPVRRALISVFDKEGIVEFARVLADLGVEIISSGGTARTLQDAGLAVVAVEEISELPRLFDGRVKTLSPLIHGGLLMRRDQPGDQEQAERFGIRPIDLLCVNLYPFQETVARPGAARADCVEMIDIGGPAMVRAAAKNHAHVVVVCSPEQYGPVAAQLEANAGAFPAAAAAALAREAFAMTAAYDAAVFQYLWQVDRAHPAEGKEAPALPSRWAAGGRLLSELRYGENPNQQAACYLGSHGFWSSFTQHQGKALSYNNLADLWAAWRCIREFDECACVVIKHATPSGVALGRTTAEAFARARDGDALSAFGGIVIVNRPGAAELAGALSEMFLEVVAAPAWESAALERFARKKSLRVLTVPDPREASPGEGLPVFKSMGEAVLVQTPLPPAQPSRIWRQVAGGEVTPGLLAELEFAWRVVRHVRSNAIALTRNGQTIGLGAGQTSRIDALDAALLKARRAEHATEGAVLASDAFFPFRDVADRAAAQGIVAIVQPGGSRRDQESIDACNEHGMAMFFTGERVFAH